MIYLKLFGGPHGVAATGAETRVVDHVVAAIVWDIWFTGYININSTDGPLKQMLIIEGYGLPLDSIYK